MNNLNSIMDTATAAGAELDRLTAAFAIGYNLGLRVKDCWNAECVLVVLSFHSFVMFSSFYHSRLLCCSLFIVLVVGWLVGCSCGRRCC